MHLLTSRLPGLPAADEDDDDHEDDDDDDHKDYYKKDYYKDYYKKYFKGGVQQHEEASTPACWRPASKWGGGGGGSPAAVSGQLEQPTQRLQVCAVHCAVSCLRACINRCCACIMAAGWGKGKR